MLVVACVPYRNCSFATMQFLLPSFLPSSCFYCRGHQPALTELVNNDPLPLLQMMLRISALQSRPVHCWCTIYTQCIEVLPTQVCFSFHADKLKHFPLYCHLPAPTMLTTSTLGTHSLSSFYLRPYTGSRPRNALYFGFANKYPEGWMQHFNILPEVRTKGCEKLRKGG